MCVFVCQRYAFSVSKVGIRELANRAHPGRGRLAWNLGIGIEINEHKYLFISVFHFLCITESIH